MSPHKSPSENSARKVGGRFAIITGAASGLGRALAVQLAQADWQLALADIDAEGCRQTAALLKDTAAPARVEPLDVTNPQAWFELIARLQSEGLSLDLLINNAGVACSGEVGDCSLENWRWLLEVNLLGTIYGCHACRDWLLQNPRGGQIVNIASVAAIVCAPSMAAYNVSKAGVIALSETLYAELRPRSVGVTVVCPGFFATNLLSTGRFHTDAERASATRLMEGAQLSADDVARAIVRSLPRRPLYLVLPARARLFWRLRRLFPTAIMRLVAWVASRARSPDASRAASAASAETVTLAGDSRPEHNAGL